MSKLISHACRGPKGGNSWEQTGVGVRTPAMGMEVVRFTDNLMQSRRECNPLQLHRLGPELPEGEMSRADPPPRPYHLVS